MPRSALIISIGLHVAAFALLTYLTGTTSLPTPVNPSRILVELTGPAGRPSGTSSSHPTSKQAPRATSSPPKALRPWGIYPPHQSPFARAGVGSPTPGTSGAGSGTVAAGGGTGGEAPTGTGAAFGYARGLSIEQDSRLWTFFDRLWVSIRDHAEYPDDLAKQRIEGQTRIALWVDRRGVFTGRVDSIEGDHPFLKTYVMGVLISALKEPLPETFWTPVAEGEKVPLLVEFNFKIQVRGGGVVTTSRQKSNHSKNLLRFHFSREMESQFNEAVTHVLTHYIPFIPLPQGLMLDFIALYRLVDNYANSRDDQRRQSDTLMLEKWQQTVRQGDLPKPSTPTPMPSDAPKS